LLGKADEVGSKLADQYEFLSIVETGGMGVVYKARHLALNQIVAIKMIQTGQIDEKHIERFRREAKALAELDHFNIIQVKDFGLTETGLPYMVLDFVEGMSLSELIKQQGVLKFETVINIFAQCADALSHAHEHGVLHRDLKPSNIMIKEIPGQKPIVKIIDFGIAKLLNSDSDGALTPLPSLHSLPRCFRNLNRSTAYTW
jgi:serine/threonine-protein kinase